MNNEIKLLNIWKQIDKDHPRTIEIIKKEFGSLDKAHPSFLKLKEAAIELDKGKVKIDSEFRMPLIESLTTKVDIEDSFDVPSDFYLMYDFYKKDMKKDREIKKQDKLIAKYRKAHDYVAELLREKLV